MNKYIFFLVCLVIINVSSEELKYECKCGYAEIFVKDPMQNTESTREDPNCEELNEGNPENTVFIINIDDKYICLLYTSPSPRDSGQSRMPSSA